MEKYRKVQKPKESSPPDEIRVTGVGHVCNYVTYSAKLFNEMQHNRITIRATGKAVSIAVSVAEVVKRRFKGLHQLTTIGCTRVMNEYEPLEEGLDKVEETRTVSFISIQLAREGDAEKLDSTAPGYQPPLDDSLVKELHPQFVSRLTRPRTRGRGGRGRGGAGRGGAFGFGRGRARGGPRGGRRGGGSHPTQQHGGSPDSSAMQQPPVIMGGAPQHHMGNPDGSSGGAIPMYDDFGSYPRGGRGGGRRGGRRGRGGSGGDFRGGAVGGYRGGRGGFRGGRGRPRGGGGGPSGGAVVGVDMQMNHGGHGMEFMNPVMPMMPGYPVGSPY